MRLRIFAMRIFNKALSIPIIVTLLTAKRVATARLQPPASKLNTLLLSLTVSATSLKQGPLTATYAAVLAPFLPLDAQRLKH